MAVAGLQNIFPCFTCAKPEREVVYPDEKATLLSADEPRPSAQVAEEVVAALLSATSSGPALQMRLDAIVGARGWKQNMAERVLERLTQALNDARDNLGPAVRAAYDKTWAVAKDIEGFVIEHPVMCTIIALGVLVIMAPWVLEALGFAATGPGEGR